jgi:prophage antirepressor-like protein
MSQTQCATAPAIFNFQSYTVRVIVRDGDPWFVASDVADALEYRDAPDMTRVLDEDEIGSTHIVRSTQGGNPNAAIISESGLYHAILKSRKPKAKPFRRWVTGEVLPAIRKTGRYEVPNAPAISILSRRWLVYFDHDKREVVKAVPNDACVMTTADFLKNFNDPDFMATTEELWDFAEATLRHLRNRLGKPKHIGNAG